MSATASADLNRSDPGDPGDPGDALDEVGTAAARCLDDGSWDDDVAAAELAAAWAGIRAVGDELRAARTIAVGGSGRVVQVNTSTGGVPKQPVDAVDVGHDGLVGDRQATRRHHGRPWQALCLWGVEVIDAFAADGHPLAPGSAGENVTIADLDWATVRPGVRMRIGTVQCEVTSYALPCTKNSRWFIGGDHQLMHHTRGPVSRVYAVVIEPGRIATGDPVTLEP